MATANDTTNAGLYESLASDTTFYDVYQNEMQYRNKQLVYELIDKGGINTTQTLQDFYSANQNTSYQNFIDVNNAIGSANYETAQNLNNSLSATNTIETYQKRVNELLLKYLTYKPIIDTSNVMIVPVLSHEPIFNETELYDLQNIANSCLDKYGNVVTQARILVTNVSNTLVEFEENCNPEFNQRKAKSQNTSIVISKVNATLYPNPNNGNMILEYDLGAEPKGEMRIFDITGKVVSIYALQNSLGKLEINEEQLKNGIYYYSIFINNKKTKTNKIVIIK